MSVFDNLSMKCIYGNLYYPKGNSKIENIHNLLKHTNAKFTYDSQLEWDDLGIATILSHLWMILSHHFM